MLTIEDICRVHFRHHKGFDVIATNPPFAGEVREGHILEGYESSRGKQRIERDVLFLERCVDLLRPGGRLAIVLPHNKFATSAWAYVREMLFKKARVFAVVGLGRNTFLPHTHQKASVLFATRRLLGDTGRPDERIFFAISEKDGKNSKGQLFSCRTFLRTKSRGTGLTTIWDRLKPSFTSSAKRKTSRLGVSHGTLPVKFQSELEEGYVLAPERYDPRRDTLRSEADEESVPLAAITVSVRRLIDRKTAGQGKWLVLDTSDAQEGIVVCRKESD